MAARGTRPAGFTAYAGPDDIVDGSGLPMWQGGGRVIDSIEALEAAERAERRNLSPFELAREMLMGVGGGTGATVGGTGDPALDRDMLRRMRYQDEAVMLLLLLAYAGALAFSASLAYQQAANSSPVTYYCDPRRHQAAMEGRDLSTFLDTFGQPPKDVQLEVTGLIPMPPLPDFLAEASVEWLGSRYAVAFSFALDLAPWVRRAQDDENGTRTGGAAAGEAEAGLAPTDVISLQQFLENSRNDLATVEIHKEVAWPDWEELATNIKSHIRQQGFEGTVMVHKRDTDVVTVYKNESWANFMHSKSVKVLCALSIFGWLLYQPYMWIRQRATQVRVNYCVDVKINDYWPLISDKITADGFVARA